MSSKEEPQPQLQLHHHASLHNNNLDHEDVLDLSTAGNEQGGHGRETADKGDDNSAAQPTTMKDDLEAPETHGMGSSSSSSSDESTPGHVEAAVATQSKRPSGPTDVGKEPVSWLDPNHNSSHHHHHHHHHHHAKLSRDANVEKALHSTDLGEVKAALEAQTQRLKRARAHLHDQRETFEKQLSYRDARMRSLQTQVGSLEAQVGPLQADSRAGSRLRARVAEQEETIHELRNRLAEAPSTGQANLHCSTDAYVNGDTGTGGGQPRQHSELERYQAQRIAQLEMGVKQLRHNVDNDGQAIARLSSMLADSSRQPSMSFLVNEVADAHERSLSMATLAGSSTRHSLGSLSASTIASTTNLSAASSPWVVRCPSNSAYPQQQREHRQEQGQQQQRQQSPLFLRSTTDDAGAAGSEAGSSTPRFGLDGLSDDGDDDGNAYIFGLEAEVDRLRAALEQTRGELRRALSGHHDDDDDDDDDDNGNRTPTSTVTAAWNDGDGLVESTVEAEDPDFGSMAQMRLQIIELSQEKDRLHAMMRARPCYLRLPDTMSDLDDGASSAASHHSFVSASASANTPASAAMPLVPPNGYARQYQPEQAIYAGGSTVSTGSSSVPPSSRGGSGWWVDGRAAFEQQLHQQQAQPQVVTGPQRRSRHYLTPTRRQQARFHRASLTDDASTASPHPSPDQQQRRQQMQAQAPSQTPGHGKGPHEPLSWLSLGFDTPIAPSVPASAQSRHKQVSGMGTDISPGNAQPGMRQGHDSDEISAPTNVRHPTSFHVQGVAEGEQEFFL